MIRNRLLFASITTSIVWMTLFCLFTEWGVAQKTVRAGAYYSNKAELVSLKRDLDQIDGYASQGLYGEASVVVGKDIKARGIYRQYLKQAAAISDELLTVKRKMDLQAGTVTLQQLGAICQKVSLTNSRFRGTFQHGEDHFQTYQLIQKAVSNLEAAISYWRIANRYRKVYRGGATERAEDDEILKTKLSLAMNAIEELKTIMETRKALSDNLEED